MADWINFGTNREAAINFENGKHVESNILFI